MCACTEPVRTGIGAVCVEYGRPKWPITMLNHTHIPGTEERFVLYFWHPMLVQAVIKRLFFLGKPRKKRLPSLAHLMISSTRCRRLRICTKFQHGGSYIFDACFNRVFLDITTTIVEE